MRRLILLLLAVALTVPAAGLPSSALTRTLRLNWHERHAFRGGYLDIHVRSITIRGLRWSVKATLANRSKVTLRYFRTDGVNAADAGFSLVYPGNNPGTRYTWGNLIVSQASSFAPRVPRLLRPGASWSGSFSGYSALPRGKLIWVGVGGFTPGGQNQGFSHVTDHSFKL